MTDEVVVDTDVLSRVRLRTEPDPSYARYVPLLQGARLVLAAQTVGELLVWAGWKNWGATKREHLEALIRTCVVVPVAMDLTRVWADLTAACLVAGHGLHAKDHTGDRWIAATAIHLGVPLVSNDTIFRDAPGLELLAPDQH